MQIRVISRVVGFPGVTCIKKALYAQAFQALPIPSRSASPSNNSNAAKYSSEFVSDNGST